MLITIFTMISPLTPAYAVGGGDGLGNTTSTGGSSSGTWSSSRTGIRVYVVDKNGNLVSNIVDVISNTAIPNYRIIACLGTRGNGTYQSFAAGGLYANGVFNSSTNSGAKVTIISDTTAGLRGKGMPMEHNFEFLIFIMGIKRKDKWTRCLRTVNAEHQEDNKHLNQLRHC